MADEISTIEEVLDPADIDHRFLDFSPKLAAGELLVANSVSVSLDLASIALGIEIPSSGQYGPTTSGKEVRWWMRVSVGQQANIAFDAGHTSLVTVTATTDSVPPRVLQRSCYAKIRNR